MFFSVSLNMFLTGGCTLNLANVFFVANYEEFFCNILTPKPLNFFCLKDNFFSVFQADQIFSHKLAADLLITKSKLR